MTSNDVTTRLTYKSFDRRIELSSSAGTTKWLWDGSVPFRELDGADSLQATYATYPGGGPQSETRGDSTYYYATDDLGSV